MREAQSQKHPKGRSHSKGNLKDVASATHHDLKTDQPHVEAAGIKTRLGASCSIKKLLYLSGRPVVFDRGWRLSMLTVARLHTLEDLPQLVSNLAKLMIDLLAQSLMFLFQTADLFLQSIDVGVDLLRHNSPGSCTFRSGHVPTLGFCPSCWGGICTPQA